MEPLMGDADARKSAVNSRLLILTFGIEAEENGGHGNRMDIPK